MIRDHDEIMVGAPDAGDLSDAPHVLVLSRGDRSTLIELTTEDLVRLGHEVMRRLAQVAR